MGYAWQAMVSPTQQVFPLMYFHIRMFETAWFDACLRVKSVSTSQDKHCNLEVVTLLDRLYLVCCDAIHTCPLLAQQVYTAGRHAQGFTFGGALKVLVQATGKNECTTCFLSDNAPATPATHPQTV